MSTIHKSTNRNYLNRVNDKEFPKAKAAVLAKKYDFDYWDGDRRINYGGYKYIPGRWEKVARKMIDYYELKSDSKILDIGCGKGFLLYEFKKLLPKSDISARLIFLKNEKEFGYLAYQNFDNILKWNRSNYFAIAVGTLSDHILYSK